MINSFEILLSLELVKRFHFAVMLENISEDDKTQFE